MDYSIVFYRLGKTLKIGCKAYSFILLLQNKSHIYEQLLNTNKFDIVLYYQDFNEDIPATSVRFKKYKINPKQTLLALLVFD